MIYTETKLVFGFLKRGVHMNDIKILPKPLQYLILIISVYIIVVAGQTFNRINLVLSERELIAINIRKAEQENSELQKTVKALDTDTYIENLARKRLGLVKPGEMVYKIVKSQDQNLKGGAF